MNREEAQRLAGRYKNTWRGGPSVDVLTDELEAMDVGVAGTMLVRLGRDHEQPPSVAQLWASYRSLRPTPQLPPSRCELCDGTGWVDAPNLPAPTLDAPDHAYTQVQPCHCQPAGTQARRIADRITDRRTTPTVAPSQPEIGPGF